MSAVAAHARQAVWASILRANGGLRVHGALPAGGCVVVANHGSHADAPSIVAALPALSRPRVAAAADYWFDSKPRAWFCRAAVGGFPVCRTGGGYADLAAQLPTLAAGHAVVVFPAGSRRSVDGHFHQGAFRLARSAGVPVVPVQLSGSAELLGSSRLPRRGTVTVTIGSPLTVDDPAQSALDVRDLLALPPTRPETPQVVQPQPRPGLRERVASVAASRGGLALTAGWAAAEAISWPVITELLIAALVLSGPVRPLRRGLTLAVTGAIGSAVGGLATLLLVRHGVVPPAPLTSAPMLEHARAEFARRGAAGLWSQPLSGVPYKVYARAAASSGVSAWRWVWLSALVRATRMIAVAVLAAAVQRVTRRWAHLYSRALAAGLLTFVLGLCLITSAWSRS